MKESRAITISDGAFKAQDRYPPPPRLGAAPRTPRKE
jgi:hypothetical protein